MNLLKWRVSTRKFRRRCCERGKYYILFKQKFHFFIFMAFWTKVLVKSDTAWICMSGYVSRQIARQALACNLRRDLVNPAIDQNCINVKHLLAFDFTISNWWSNLRVEGANIRVAGVALEACWTPGKVDTWPTWFDTKLFPLLKEPAIADNTTSVLPSPISSAIIPLWASSRWGRFAPVKTCWKLLKILGGLLALIGIF